MHTSTLHLHLRFQLSSGLSRRVRVVGQLQCDAERQCRVQVSPKQHDPGAQARLGHCTTLISPKHIQQTCLF